MCNSCGKHHRITCRQRFDIFFGKNSYEILETPIPAEDPLNWEDTKSYKDRLKDARKKTEQNCAVMIARGKVIDIDVTVGAINFYFIGGSDAAINMDKWEKPLNILNSSKIVCVPREGISNQSVETMLLDIYPQAQIRFLKNIDEKISSTTIRTFIQRNESHKEYLNKNVYTYILKNKMYL